MLSKHDATKSYRRKMLSDLSSDTFKEYFAIFCFLTYQKAKTEFTFPEIEDIFKKFQIPTIIGYIVTGTLISEFFNLKSNDEISHIAEFGIAFLMFTIGLEFSFKHLMGMKKEVFLNGGLQVCLSGFIMGVMLYYALHLKDETALIAGLALALSSTAIVLKTLNDSGDVSKIYGRKALGILLFQDIAVIPILLMIDMFSSQDASINELLLKTFTSAIILIVVLFLLGKYVINWIFYKVIQTNSQEVFIATILFMVVGSSTLAHFFGFSYSLGAFLAGMMMAETQYKHQIEVDLIPFRDLLLGLFFITVGMQINFAVVISNIWLVLGLVFSVMVIKAIVVFAILNIYLKRRVAAKRDGNSLSRNRPNGRFSAYAHVLRSSHRALSSSVWSTSVHNPSSTDGRKLFSV